MSRSRRRGDTCAGDNLEQSVPVDHRPRVSIGLPVYNEAGFVGKALDSLLTLNFSDFELIISDNASTDRTFAICEEYAARDPRIALLKNSENLGAVANFKLVLQRARGEYFMWAAADDEWLPDFIDILLPELEAHPDAGVAMCATERFYENGKHLDTIRFTGTNNPNGWSYYQMLKGMVSRRKYNLYFYGLFRTELLKRAIVVFPDILGCDRLFLCQVALAARFRYVDKIQYLRLHRAKHDEAYRAEAESGWVKMKQIITLGALLLRSRVIPFYRKLLLPLAIFHYSIFIYRKSFGLAKVRHWMKRYLNLNSEIRFGGKIIFMGAGLLAMSTILLTQAWKYGGIVWMGLAAILVGAAFSFVYVVLNFRKKLRILSKESKLVREQLGQVLSLARDVGALQDQLREHASFPQLHGLIESSTLMCQQLAVALPLISETRTLQDQLRELIPVRRELRYLVDLAINTTVMPPLDKTNMLALYTRERYERYRKAVTFATLLAESKIRELYFTEIFPNSDRISIPIGAINELTGHPNKTDMLYVCGIAKLLGARQIFEFGTYLGRTTYHLTFAHDDAHVTTLNLPPGSDPRYGKYLGVYFRGTDREQRITQIYCDSLKFDTAPYCGKFDLVFVDGDHSYDAVKNDTTKAFELLRPGGAIIWHDYAPKSGELVKFFREFTEHRPLFRIKRTCLLLYLDGVDPLSFEPHPMLAAIEREYYDSDPFIVEELYHA